MSLQLMLLLGGIALIAVVVFVVMFNENYSESDQRYLAGFEDTQHHR